MKYLSIIKKQGITGFKAPGHLTFLKTSVLFRTYLTSAHKKKYYFTKALFAPVVHKTKERLPHTLFNDTQLAKQCSQLITPEKANFQTQVCLTSSHMAFT